MDKDTMKLVNEFSDRMKRGEVKFLPDDEADQFLSKICDDAEKLQAETTKHLKKIRHAK